MHYADYVPAHQGHRSDGPSLGVTLMRGLRRIGHAVYDAIVESNHRRAELYVRHYLYRRF